MKKIFRIEGFILKGNKKIKFTKEVVDISRENALEKIYSILGSNHKVKRSRILIKEIKEISESEVRDRYLKQFLNLFKSG